MRLLRYSINVTLDGCCHHEAGLPDEESMRYWTNQMERADALLFGRVTYEMMESAWRRPTTGPWPDWMDQSEIRFAEAIDRAKKHVADLGLIDEYEFLVQPVLAGHGPTLLAGLRERIQLELVERNEFRSGAVALRYRPTRDTA
jgi:hypothetical protein